MTTIALRHCSRYKKGSMLNSIEQLKKNIEAFIQAKRQLLDDAEHLSLFAMTVEARR